jgi:hypothetical protein
MLVNRNEEIVLPVEDIAEVVASSYDRRFPPKNIFRHSGTHRGSEFNSIANAQVQDLHSYTNSSGNSNSNSGALAFGAYTPELSAINAHLSHSSHHGGLSASNSSSNLQALTGGSAVVVPVAQRRLSTAGWGGSANGAALLAPGGNKAVKGWICSGLVPQFIHVAFLEKWEVKKVGHYTNNVPFQQPAANCAARAADRGVLQRHRAAVRANMRQRLRRDEGGRPGHRHGAHGERVSTPVVAVGINLSLVWLWCSVLCGLAGRSCGRRAARRTPSTTTWAACRASP